MRDKIKRKIVSKMGIIKRNGVSTITISDKKEISNLFNKLKTIDEALYISLVVEYIDIIQMISK